MSCYTIRGMPTCTLEIKQQGNKLFEVRILYLLIEVPTTRDKKAHGIELPKKGVPQNTYGTRTQNYVFRVLILLPT
jgi:hypothetical protein